jgi:hypothetical protein
MVTKKYIVYNPSSISPINSYNVIQNGPKMKVLPVWMATATSIRDYDRIYGPRGGGGCGGA